MTTLPYPTSPSLPLATTLIRALTRTDEYTILMLALSITLTLRGGGSFSIDRLLDNRIH